MDNQLQRNQEQHVVHLEHKNAELSRRAASLERQLASFRRHCRCGADTQQCPPVAGHSGTVTEHNAVLTEKPQASSRSLKRKSSGLCTEFHVEHPSIKDSSLVTPRWKTRVLELVREIPASNDWRQAMEERGIYKAMSTGEAVAFLLGPQNLVPMPSPSNMLAAPIPCSGSNITRSMIDDMRCYAASASLRSDTASLVLSLAGFQKFVALSACVVFNALKMDRKDIFTIVRTSFGEMTEDHCSRMMNTAKYMNILIDKLATYGFDGRAAELVLYCTLTSASLLWSPLHADRPFREPCPKLFLPLVEVAQTKSCIVRNADFGFEIFQRRGELAENELVLRA